MPRRPSRRGAVSAAPAVVLDTNVAVPGVIGYAMLPPKTVVSTACVLAASNGRVRLAFSAPLLNEVLDVLQREPFGLPYRLARQNLALLQQGADIVPVAGTLRVLTRDPDDNMVLETAVAARATFLVTRNLDDFEEVGRNAQGTLWYRGVSIVSPEEFLRRLRYEGR